MFPSLQSGTRPFTFVQPTWSPVNRSRCRFSSSTLRRILTPDFKPGQKIVIADANEQTIDVVSYTVASMSPLEVEHFRGPECNALHFQI